eukprot:GHVH01009954.1.p1 GENE.GHVH01009954.1~~GHVH01009954.1.p1  ORF type:complete len:1078 (-),score=163.76 GHVH01009954.1:5259-8492(-)
MSHNTSKYYALYCHNKSCKPKNRTFRDAWISCKWSGSVELRPTIRVELYERDTDRFLDSASISWRGFNDGDEFELDRSIVQIEYGFDSAPSIENDFVEAVVPVRAPGLNKGVKRRRKTKTNSNSGLASPYRVPSSPHCNPQLHHGHDIPHPNPVDLFTSGTLESWYQSLSTIYKTYSNSEFIKLERLWLSEAMLMTGSDVIQAFDFLATRQLAQSPSLHPINTIPVAQSPSLHPINTIPVHCNVLPDLINTPTAQHFQRYLDLCHRAVMEALVDECRRVIQTPRIIFQSVDEYSNYLVGLVAHQVQSVLQSAHQVETSAWNARKWTMRQCDGDTVSLVIMTNHNVTEAKVAGRAALNAAKRGEDVRPASPFDSVAVNQYRIDFSRVSNKDKVKEMRMNRGDIWMLEIQPRSQRTLVNRRSAAPPPVRILFRTVAKGLNPRNQTLNVEPLGPLPTFHEASVDCCIAVCLTKLSGIQSVDFGQIDGLVEFLALGKVLERGTTPSLLGKPSHVVKTWSGLRVKSLFRSKFAEPSSVPCQSIDKPPGSSDDSCQILDDLRTIGLNAEQIEVCRVVQDMVTSKRDCPFVLLHGVFGSGKSTVLAVIVSILLSAINTSSARILFICATNCAIDIVLKKWLDFIQRHGKLMWNGVQLSSLMNDYTRMGKFAEISPNLLINSTATTNQKKMFQKEFSGVIDKLSTSSGVASEWLMSLRSALLEERAPLSFMESKKKKLFAMTLSTALNNDLLDSIRKDQKREIIILLDEATQLTEVQVTALLSLYNPRCVIQSGDPQQLPAVLPAMNALRISQFERLSSLPPSSEDFARESVTAPIEMMTQYRCAPKIGNICSRLFYNGKLKNGGHLATRPCIIPNESPLQFKFVQGSEERTDSRSYRNPVECDSILSYICQSVSAFKARRPVEIGIISLYRGQVDYISKKWADKLRSDPRLSQQDRLKIKISTVDAFQGSETDIMLLSTVRSQSHELQAAKEDSFTSCVKRTNVALSRAKYISLIFTHKAFVQVPRSPSASIPHRVILCGSVCMRPVVCEAAYIGRIDFKMIRRFIASLVILTSFGATFGISVG